MANNDKFIEARKHAKVKFDFYVHLAVYVLVISALLIVNLLTDSEYLWFIWPALGWGIALLLHGASAFLLMQKKEDIIDALTRRELDKRHSNHH